MKLDPTCIPCLLTQALRAARIAAGGMTREREKELLDAVMDILREDRVLEDLPAVTAARVYRLVERFVDNDDPYRLEKRDANRIALGFYPHLKEQVARSKNKLKTAAILAIAGNVIDRGSKQGLSDARRLDRLIDTSGEGGGELLAIDHFDLLESKLKHGGNLLYIGDNAGEIVFDRLFIEEILSRHDVKVTFVVRGGPIINDATMEDAVEVGLAGLVRVIEGTPTPGLVLSKASEDLVDAWRSADVILSKGQGNFEMLSEQPVSDRLFFLFKVKCDLMERLLDVPLGSSLLARWDILSRRLGRRCQDGSVVPVVHDG